MMKIFFKRGTLLHLGEANQIQVTKKILHFVRIFKLYTVVCTIMIGHQFQTVNSLVLNPNQSLRKPNPKEFKNHMLWTFFKQMEPTLNHQLQFSTEENATDYINFDKCTGLDTSTNETVKLHCNAFMDPIYFHTFKIKPFYVTESIVLMFV